MHGQVPVNNTFEGEIYPQMVALLTRLQQSVPYRDQALHNLCIHSGTYVFYEDGKPMYVGIVGRCSKQDIRKRIQQHRNGRPSQPLASRMTIEYLRLGSMAVRQLRKDSPEFMANQDRVRNMEVRAVEIKCCVTLAAFEIYAAVNLQTPYNDFCTH